MSKRQHTAAPTVDSEYVQIETVAETLGIPVSLIKRRVEVGDVPSHKIRENGTVAYYVRWEDLGIVPPASEAESPVPEKVNLEDFVEQDPWGGLSGSTSCVEESSTTPDEASEVHSGTYPEISDDTTDPWGESSPSSESAYVSPEADASSTVDTVTGYPVSEAEVPQTVAEDDQDILTVQLTGVSQSLPDVESHVVQFGSDTASTPLVQESPAGFRQEVSSMQLDAREIVSGLLDRWEHTLEQRIYAEHRQRFETELLSRQSTVKNLQMEIQTSRAQHAADLAQKDRLIAERERHIAECEREIRDLRSQLSKKRRWPFTS